MKVIMVYKKAMEFRTLIYVVLTVVGILLFGAVIYRVVRGIIG